MILNEFEQYQPSPIQLEIDELAHKVAETRLLLLHPSPSEPTSPQAAPAPSPPPAPKPPRKALARVRLPFSFRPFYKRDTYIPFPGDEEKKSLISPRDPLSRRDSDDSNATLVDGTSPHNDDKENLDTPGALLAILAPLVASVQKLSPRVREVAPSKFSGERDCFESACKYLLSLLETLAARPNTIEQGKECEEHDLEMRTLLLSALIKKVAAELNALDHAPAPPASSLVVQQPSNPFVRHATDPALTSLTPRRISGTSSRSIPSVSLPIGGKGTYTSFVAGSQATSTSWARNVVRLGSFQNSMLFSPSPIAVRRIATPGPVVKT